MNEQVNCKPVYGTLAELNIAVIDGRLTETDYEILRSYLAVLFGDTAGDEDLTDDPDELPEQCCGTVLDFDNFGQPLSWFWGFRHDPNDRRALALAGTLVLIDGEHLPLPRDVDVRAVRDASGAITIVHLGFFPPL